jgi:hypothetical protein
MFESVRIRTRDEATAVTLANDLLARFHPRLVHEDDAEWEVQVDSEADDDLPDILGILHDRLHSADPTIDVLIDGEPYTPRRDP